MKKQVVYSLAAVLALSARLSQAQTHELSFKVGRAYQATSKTPPDSRSSASKTQYGGFGADLGYGYYFANDTYIRLSGFYATSGTSRRSNSSLTNPGYSEWKYDESMQNFGGDLEFGKRLSYKFIDFLAGVGAGYYISPSHKATELSVQRQPSWSTSPDSDNRSVTTMPGMSGYSLYLNTSIYFRVCKPLYVGLEVGNGFVLMTQKGSRVTETTQSLSNGTVYSSVDQVTVSESRFDMQVFRTKFALRYRFGGGAKAAAVQPAN